MPVRGRRRGMTPLAYPARSTCSYACPHGASARTLAAASALMRRSGLPNALLPAAGGRRRLSVAAVAAPAQQTAMADREFAASAHGFELQQKQFVREYDSHVLLYRHKKTGGSCCLLSCSDDHCACAAASSSGVWVVLCCGLCARVIHRPTSIAPLLPCCRC